MKPEPRSVCPDVIAIRAAARLVKPVSAMSMVPTSVNRTATAGRATAWVGNVSSKARTARGLAAGKPASPTRTAPPLVTAAPGLRKAPLRLARIARSTAHSPALLLVAPPASTLTRCMERPRAVPPPKPVSFPLAAWATRPARATVCSKGVLINCRHATVHRHGWVALARTDPDDASLCEKESSIRWR